jgi:uncharacterized protein (DUF952 family)
VSTIYKICEQAAWCAAEAAGGYDGSSAVRWARPLPDEIDGRRVFPELKP